MILDAYGGEKVNAVVFSVDVVWVVSVVKRVDEVGFVVVVLVVFTSSLGILRMPPSFSLLSSSFQSVLKAGKRGSLQRGT